MIKVLFICHGNICRSPMAEFYFKELVKKKGLADRFEIASAATSTEELGNPPYPPVRQLLKRKGIDCSGKFARQMQEEDYKYYDYLIGMDHYNYKNMQYRSGETGREDGYQKISLLLDWTDHPRDVADPWYTGKFETTWEDVVDGCGEFLKYLIQTGKIM